MYGYPVHKAGQAQVRDKFSEQRSFVQFAYEPGPRYIYFCGTYI